MIQSQPFISTHPFSQRPLSPPITAQSLLSSAVGGAPNSVKGSSQQMSFASSQNSSMFSSLNGSLNSSADNSTSVSPPITSPPAYSLSSNAPGSQGQNQTLSGLPSSMSSSSFFPSGSFPFSMPSQYGSQSNVNSTAPSQSIPSAIPVSASNSLPGSATQSSSVGMSNFFPMPVSPVMEDGSFSNNFFALHISNLPRDIKEREFNVLFTFAQDFAYSELLRSHGTSEDGLPYSVVGVGYFKSLNAASSAMSVLAVNPHVFLSRDAMSNTNVPSSSLAIKCDIRVTRQEPPQRVPGFSLNGNTSPSNGPSQQPQSNTSPIALLPQQGSSQGFKNASSRFVFPGGMGAYGPLEMPPNLQDMYPEEGNKFSPTSPRDNFVVDNEYLPRMSGKSLLLESQGKEDQEYTDLVKDPMGWFTHGDAGQQGPNANFSSHQVPSAIQPPQKSSVAKPQQQQTSRGHSPPTGNAINNVSPHQQNFKPANRPVGPGPVGQQFNNSANGSDNWNDKKRASTTRSFQNLSISGNAQNGNGSNPATVGDGKQVVVPYSPTNSSTNIQVLQNGGRVLPPVNPADQNPPCNTLYVGNLPPDTNEEELKELFSSRRGYKRLCFRTKANGPMCFVEFDDVSWATRALEELYGFGLSNSVKGGIRLSFSKNPLGVRSQTNGSNNGNGSNGNNNGSSGNHHHSRIGSQHMPTNGGVAPANYASNQRAAGYGNGPTSS